MSFLGRGLSRLNDWRSPVYVTRKTTVVSPKDDITSNDIMIINYDVEKKKELIIKKIKHVWMNGLQ